jgi:DNA-binding NarL/FixJ family response regulator
VLIADDHRDWRSAVAEALDVDGFDVCGEADDAESAVQLALSERPDIVLLDINRPGGGIAAAAAIAREAPEVAVVMLTISRNDDDLFEALRAGARGYLLKDIDPARLPLALEGVLDGEAAVPRPLVARLIEEFQRDERHRRLPLVRGQRVRMTTREWEVLDALAEGKTTAQIADELYVSQVTIRTHISAILKKLDVADRDAAIRMVLGVDPP